MNQNEMIERINFLGTTVLEEPRFIQPIRINYQQNGVDKSWEAVKSHDSVATLLYHKEQDAFLLVKQFRPPVYLNNKGHGITFELCVISNKR